MSKLIAFYESFLISIQSIFQSFHAQYCAFKKSIEKTSNFNPYSLITKNTLIDNCLHVVYQINNNKKIIVDLKNESELKQLIIDLKSLLKLKTYSFVCTFFCFVPISKTCTVYSMSSKTYIDIEKTIPFVVTFYKSINDNKTILQNFIFKTYFDFANLEKNEQNRIAKLFHTFLQFEFEYKFKLPESFYVLSLQHLDKTFDLSK